PLPLVEFRTRVSFGSGWPLRGQVCITFIEPRVTTCHLAHTFGEYAERTLFQKNAGNPLSNQAARFGVANPGCDNQDTARKSDLPRGGKKLRGPLGSQVVIEQNQIYRRLRQCLKGFPNGCAGRYLELRPRS